MRVYGYDLQAKYDGRYDADGGEEKFLASVVAGSDAAPVVQAVEQVRDPVALFVKFPLMARGVLALKTFRGAGGNLNRPEFTGEFLVQ